MDCPRCSARDVIEIRHRLSEGVELYFFSCHRCEERWWDKDGERLSLADVLALARRR